MTNLTSLQNNFGETHPMFRLQNELNIPAADLKVAQITWSWSLTNSPLCVSLSFPAALGSVYWAELDTLWPGAPFSPRWAGPPPSHHSWDERLELGQCSCLVLRLLQPPLMSCCFFIPVEQLLYISEGMSTCSFYCFNRTCFSPSNWLNGIKYQQSAFKNYEIIVTCAKPTLTLHLEINRLVLFFRKRTHINQDFLLITSQMN